jgi:exodeoxyribonuclease VIII
MKSPEIILDQPPETYFASEGVSKHDLDLVNISPAHYRSAKSTPRDEATPAMKIGTLVHTAILEPHRFEESYILAPDADRRTKDGKASWEAVESAARELGKIVIKPSELENIKGMKESVFAHRSGSAAIKAGGLIEASLYATHENGVRLRGRPDLISKGNAIIDVKTCAKGAGGKAEFAKSVANFRYDVQAAFYLDLAALVGMPKEAFVFLVVEKEAPFAVAVYQLDTESVEAGRQQYLRNLTMLSECMSFDEWPAYSSEVEVISLPKWKLNQLAEVTA